MTLVLALVLAGAAVGLAVYAVGGLVAPQRSALDDVLAPYQESRTLTTELGGDATNDALAQTALVSRAVELTEDIAERRGFLARAEAQLEGADVPLRAAEALFFHAAIVVLVGLLTLAVNGWNPLPAILAALLALVTPVAALRYLTRRRQKRLTSLLPDMLQLLSGSLRAGYSLMQGVEAVSKEVEEPMGSELRRVVTEAMLGRELVESLDAVAERMQSADFAWAVMAIKIQREVGGNLPELLLTVGETMTQRERLRREVAGLTAEGRMSAIVLGILPPGLGGAMYVLNPEYISTLFTETSGQMALGVATIMLVGGFAWMKKIVEIEI